MSKTCEICIEKFNKSTRLSVECPACEFVCCRSCLGQYILNETDSKCMSCKALFTDHFVDDTFTKVFVNTQYNYKRANQLLENEKAILPATQSIAEIIINEATTRNEISEIQNYRDELFVQIRKIDLEIDFQRSKIDNAKLALRGKRMMLESDFELSSNKRQKPCCNDKSNCNGFMTQENNDSDFVCGMCKISVCKDCHEVKNDKEPHICNEDDYNSVQRIHRDSKPCPKCNSLIHKIDGCNQMWCTNCKTPFHWLTLKQLSGRWHNPMHVEYVRNQNRVTTGCNGDNMTVSDVQKYFLKNKPDSDDQQIQWMQEMVFVTAIWRSVVDMRYSQLPRFIDNESDRKKQALRIRFLMNQISEEQWKQQLVIIYKNLKCKADHSIMINTYVNSMADIITRQMSDNRIETEEITSLLDYYNSCAYKLANRYNTMQLIVRI